MRILVLSDLHLEHAPFDPPAFEGDVVVLAGDIRNGVEALRWARTAFPRHPIVQIAGNHEFYDGEYDETLSRMREAAPALGIHFLENDAVTIDGVRFLGCTLWTDFRVFEAPGRAMRIDAAAAMDANRRMLADFFAIRIGSDGRRFAPEDAVALHQRSRAWLAAELARARRGPTVVVSHHLPSWRSVHPEYAAWVTNAGFASDLDALVDRSDLWIHGHTHTAQAYPAGRSRVVCNPRGYPSGVIAARAWSTPGTSGTEPPESYENQAFDPALTIEVAVG